MLTGISEWLSIRTNLPTRVTRTSYVVCDIILSKIQPLMEYFNAYDAKCKQAKRQLADQLAGFHSELILDLQRETCRVDASTRLIHPPPHLNNREYEATVSDIQDFFRRLETCKIEDVMFYVTNISIISRVVRDMGEVDETDDMLICTIINKVLTLTQGFNVVATQTLTDDQIRDIITQASTVYSLVVSYMWHHRSAEKLPATMICAKEISQLAVELWNVECTTFDEGYDKVTYTTNRVHAYLKMCEDCREC
jgi:hypothetical protein